MHQVIKTYSTEAVARHQQVDYWHSLISDAFTSLEAFPNGQQHFCGQLQKTSLGNIGLSEVLSTPSSVRHTRSMISRETVPYFLLHMQLNGSSINQQDGREAQLKAGDFTLCDSTRPYELSFNDMNDMLVLRIPEKRLKQYIATPEDLTCVRMDGHSGMSSLTSSLLVRLWDNFNFDLDERSKDRLADVILNTMAVAYESINSSKMSESSTRSVRRIQVTRFIETHLNRSDLSPVFVAKSHSMSVRYLHMLFENEGETVNQFILRRRLEEAKNQLMDQRRDKVTVSEIAYGLGFNHVTHFGRVFKTRFGVSPKEFRSL